MLPLQQIISIKIINEKFYIFFCTKSQKSSVYFILTAYLIHTSHISNAQ